MKIIKIPITEQNREVYWSRNKDKKAWEKLMSECPSMTSKEFWNNEWEEFDKVNKKNKDPELESINSFNDTVKKANEIKDMVLEYVDKIKRERAYNIDLCMTFERYVEIADKDAERAMAFLKEVYPFNEETEVFIRKRYNMSIGVDPEEN